MLIPSSALRLPAKRKCVSLLLSLFAIIMVWSVVFVLSEATFKHSAALSTAVLNATDPSAPASSYLNLTTTPAPPTYSSATSSGPSPTMPLDFPPTPHSDTRDLIAKGNWTESPSPHLQALVPPIAHQAPKDSDEQLTKEQKVRTDQDETPEVGGSSVDSSSLPHDKGLAFWELISRMSGIWTIIWGAVVLIGMFWVYVFSPVSKDWESPPDDDNALMDRDYFRGFLFAPPPPPPAAANEGGGGGNGEAAVIPPVRYVATSEQLAEVELRLIRLEERIDALRALVEQRLE
ncbi:hypothetical protein BJ508DRAFT_380763 [Ascobolus immersus RN42]|uniref:Transmembrane protein n=1 Tax=Ascobolus immersus RN42 TaxID=1160509 RepID=A0A3N4HMC1_ASCIM|nr:hypothetical protein BJ508DRAFT_380763 [Ascobolus immersus RN42]